MSNVKFLDWWIYLVFLLWYHTQLNYIPDFSSHHKFNISPPPTSHQAKNKLIDSEKLCRVVNKHLAFKISKTMFLGLKNKQNKFWGLASLRYPSKKTFGSTGIPVPQKNLEPWFHQSTKKNPTLRSTRPAHTPLQLRHMGTYKIKLRKIERTAQKTSKNNVRNILAR